MQTWAWIGFVLSVIIVYFIVVRAVAWALRKRDSNVFGLSILIFSMGYSAMVTYIIMARDTLLQ